METCQATARPKYDEALELLRRSAQGDPGAEEELVHRNLGLVQKALAELNIPESEREDAFQEGALGLLEGIRRFDPERGTRLSTYALWWIRQRIRRHLKGPTRVVRLPEYVHDHLSKIQQVLEACPELDPSDLDGLSRATGIPRPKLAVIVQAAQPWVPLEERARGRAEPDGRGALQDPHSIVERRHLLRQAFREFRHLPDRESEILSLRFGLRDGRERSRREIGEAVGVSRERVRQLEGRALARLGAELELRTA